MAQPNTHAYLATMPDRRATAGQLAADHIAETMAAVAMIEARHPMSLAPPAAFPIINSPVVNVPSPSSPSPFVDHTQSATQSTGKHWTCDINDPNDDNDLFYEVDDASTVSFADQVSTTYTGTMGNEEQG